MIASSQDDLDRACEQRAGKLYQEACLSLYQDTDRIFVLLMLLQWIGGIVMAACVSPKTWIGTTSFLHVHVTAAVALGALLSSLPIFLAIKRPGAPLTRHVIAIAQMLWSALLIHLSGGRIETHFHVFGSLAFLAFYRDWRVLITATVIVAADHFVRGYYWPQSVFGVFLESPYRWIEHVAWVLFEDVFLIKSCWRGTSELLTSSERQAKLESINETIEETVRHRTRQLQVLNDQLEGEIVEREQAENSLRFTKYAIDHAADAALWICPELGHFTYVNESAATLLGYDTQQLLSKQVFDVFPEITAQHWQTLVERLRVEGKSCFELSQLAKSGRHIPVEVNAYFARFEGQDYVMAYVRDITERKDAEARTSRLGRLVDESVNEIYIFDAKTFAFREVNRGARENLGYSMGELRGMTPIDLKPEFDERGFAARVKPLKDGKVETLSFETVHRRKDGSTYPVDVRLQMGECNSQPAFMAIVVDITERRKVEAERDAAQLELIEASRRTGMAEIATGVLHNVGNVLNTVNVSANLATEKLRGSRVAKLRQAAALLAEHDDDLAAYLATDEKGRRLPAYLQRLAAKLVEERDSVLSEISALTTNIQHIKDIIQMQQSYARVGGATQRVGVKDMLEDAINLTLSRLASHDIRLVREFEDVPPLMTVKHQVLQILTNLISNAAKAMRDVSTERTLTLRTKAESDAAWIEVSDTGVGIPSENLTRIFRHGFTTRDDGHGFGLHSCALAAKKLGGSLSAASEGVGCGATFTLRLPLQHDSGGIVDDEVSSLLSVEH